MARAIWSGTISFGLLNIPVEVLSAKEDEHLSFRLLDKHDFSPIGYRQYNKATGKEVQRKDIVKAYEYDKDQFVVVNEKDFEKANPKATKSIDIEDFVKFEDLDFMLFEKPYYLVPGKNGEKGYVLLNKVLQDMKRVAIGNIIIRTRQHLAAIVSQGDFLVLEVLRYAHEVRELREADFLQKKSLEKIKISQREMKMAHDLVAGMTEKWKPDKYKDTYQQDLLKLINAKVKRGESMTVETPEAPAPTNTNVLDLTALLKKSLATAAKHGKRKAVQHRVH